jgi:prophage tail gpP-like protein
MEQGRKENLMTYRQDWKEYNREQAEREKDEDFLRVREYKVYQGDKLVRTRIEEQGLSRRCELCGSVGFTKNRIHRLKRKMILEGDIWRCQNKDTCEERVNKFIDGRWTLDNELWR